MLRKLFSCKTGLGIRDKGGATVGVSPIAAGLFTIVTEVGTYPQGLSRAVSGLGVVLTLLSCTLSLSLETKPSEGGAAEEFSRETAVVEAHSNSASVLTVFLVSAQWSVGNRVFRPMPSMRPIKSKLSPADASRALRFGGGCERDLRGFLRR